MAAETGRRWLEQGIDGSKRRHRRLDLEGGDVSRGGSRGGGGMSRGDSSTSSGSGGVSRGSGSASSGRGLVGELPPPLSLLSLFVLGFRVAASLLGQLK
jgi:hypothetical protein